MAKELEERIVDALEDIGGFGKAAPTTKPVP